MTRRSALMATMAAGLRAAPSDFNGRWNLRVANEPRNRAWWLEVGGADTASPHGRFVGAPGGQMDPIPAIRVDKDELVWEFRRDDGKRIYRARVAGDSISGSMEVEGRAASRLEFQGKRAPVISDIDDGRWKPGKPVKLFNGRNTAGWSSRIEGRPIEWRAEGGLLKNNDKAADIVSAAKFWNFMLHVEFRVGPKSNSGIGLRGRYEVQIYEDHGRAPDGHSNGAIYSRIPPTSNASKPAGEWQTFDITLVGRTVTVLVNGTIVVDRQHIEGLTAMANDPDEDPPGPISLQGDHGPVEFRELLVTPLTR
jgi:hypothetical protein